MKQAYSFTADFPLQNGRALRVRVDFDRLAAGFPAACERMEAARKQFGQAGADELPRVALEYGNAAAGLCVCLFGEASARSLVDGWSGNYVGFARALAGFVAGRLRKEMKRYARKTARRCRREFLL